SGQSEYLLNSTPVRLRDIQDLLSGTGLGRDAGVVIEAKMIDLLLSDRAEERRSLFEEAAGIGLYRDRKHSTERRLEETATDLQRLEDLIAEVQSQIRSLARQKGKTERHGELMRASGWPTPGGAGSGTRRSGPRRGAGPRRRRASGKRRRRSSSRRNGSIGKSGRASTRGRRPRTRCGTGSRCSAGPPGKPKRR